MKAKVILRRIGEKLLLAVLFTVFVCLVSALGVGAVVLIGLVGEWIGIGYKVFIYVVWFIAYCKIWEALAWIVDKIIEREEQKKGENHE